MNERGPGPADGEDPEKKDDDVPMPPDDPARGPPVEEPPSREPPKRASRADVARRVHASSELVWSELRNPLTSARGS
jgi:hypothetical protein